MSVRVDEEEVVHEDIGRGNKGGRLVNGEDNQSKLCGDFVWERVGPER